VNIPCFSDPAAWQRLHVGPLSPFIDTFAQRLSKQGYASSTACDKLRVVAKLSQWLERRQLSLNALNEQQVATFIHELNEHQRRFFRGDKTTLGDLLEQLRNTGVVPVPITASNHSALDRLEDDYTRYLTQERGLTAASVDNYLALVHRFLSLHFGDGRLALEQLTARDVTRFVLEYIRTLSPKRAQLNVSALRSFFRFLYQRGELATDLAGAVPTVANWRLSSLPKFLGPGQVEQLLQSCNQTNLVGQRDYTVLLLLARLGLRAGEVVHLCLDDIDWHAGLLNIRGKGGQMDQLPLPVDVGEALATYLHDGRPHCATRRVFVRMRAPREGFASSVAIDSIMRRALQRAGLEPPRKGAHLLRHTLATSMLRNGACLAEIGQLLRHRHPQTTEIYAKVDPSTLGDLAQPWPGEVS